MSIPEYNYSNKTSYIEINTNQTNNSNIQETKKLNELNENINQVVINQLSPSICQHEQNSLPLNREDRIVKLEEKFKNSVIQESNINTLLFFSLRFNSVSILKKCLKYINKTYAMKIHFDERMGPNNKFFTILIKRDIEINNKIVSFLGKNIEIYIQMNDSQLSLENRKNFIAEFSHKIISLHFFQSMEPNSENILIPLLKNCQNLKKLHLYFKEITNESLKSILANVNQNNLEELNLNCQIKIIPPVEDLKFLKKLTLKCTNQKEVEGSIKKNKIKIGLDNPHTELLKKILRSIQQYALFFKFQAVSVDSIDLYWKFHIHSDSELIANTPSLKLSVMKSLKLNENQIIGNPIECIEGTKEYNQESISEKIDQLIIKKLKNPTLSQLLKAKELKIPLPENCIIKNKNWTSLETWSA